MGKKKSFSTYFNGIDPNAKDLLTRLLAFNSKERLTAEEALEHPYLKESVNQFLKFSLLFRIRHFIVFSSLNTF